MTLYGQSSVTGISSLLSLDFAKDEDKESANAAFWTLKTVTYQLT